MRKWGLRNYSFMKKYSGHDTIINALALNDDNVLVSAADDGSLKFWDWHSAACFQNTQTIVQSGSLESESAIYALAFDRTGSRLFSCEGDKTVKVWKEVETA